MAVISLNILMAHYIQYHLSISLAALSMVLISSLVRFHFMGCGAGSKTGGGAGRSDTSALASARSARRTTATPSAGVCS